MAQMQRSVFLSHSHVDRQVATLLQRVLEKHGARTYLDQDHIQGGDVLPARIREGIKSCDTLLLLWSFRASTSTWVGREWETAWKLKKKIIPYTLDSTPLPMALEDRVFVEADDQTRAHAGLLKAVLGRAFTPEDPAELFPGKWHAEVELLGNRQSYEIDLRGNGQVEGIARFQTTGLLGELAVQFGISHVLTTPISVTGNWTFDGAADLLALTVTASGFGRSQTDTIHIRATGRERDAIQGTDLGGRTWTLTRVAPQDVGGRAEPESGENAARRWFEAIGAQDLKTVGALSSTPFYDGDGDGQVLRSIRAIRERYRNPDAKVFRPDQITCTHTDTVAGVRRADWSSVLDRPAAEMELNDENVVVVLKVAFDFPRLSSEQLKLLPEALRGLSLRFLLKRDAQGFRVYGYW